MKEICVETKGFTAAEKKGMLLSQETLNGNRMTVSKVHVCRFVIIVTAHTEHALLPNGRS